MQNVKLFEPKPMPVVKKHNTVGKLSVESLRKTPINLISETDFGKLSFSVLVNQVALNANEDIKHTRYYKQKLKQAVNVLNPILIKAEAEEYDKIFDMEAELTTAHYDNINDLAKVICSIGLQHFGEVKSVLNAFKRDKGSILGLANKINRQK